jgi:hypothetical protein
VDVLQRFEVGRDDTVAYPRANCPDYLLGRVFQYLTVRDLLRIGADFGDYPI